MTFKNIYAGLRGRLRFYKHHSSYELMWGRVYFSQYGEDVFLLEYFQGQQNGFYVDVGAYHPVMYSNTYSLYRGGWRGINIEPDPVKRALFQKFRPQDRTLSLAISDTEGTATFAMGEELSGIVDDNYFHQVHLGTMQRIQVQTKPLRDVLDQHIRPIGRCLDVLSVDCEGHDEVVLGSNNWDKYRPLIVLCEAFDTSGAHRLEVLLTQQSYRRIATCGPTLIFEDLLDRPNRPRPYH